MLHGQSGATSTALDLCNRRSCEHGHLLCKQGVTSSSLASAATGNVCAVCRRTLRGLKRAQIAEIWRLSSTDAPGHWSVADQPVRGGCGWREVTSAAFLADDAMA